MDWDKMSVEDKVDTIRPMGQMIVKYTDKVDAVEDGLKKLANAVSEKIAAIQIGGAAGGGTSHEARANNLRLFNAALKANLDTEDYERYGQALRAYLHRGEAGVTHEIRNSLSVAYDPGSGYLVPPDTTGRTAEILRTTSPIRNYADVQTTSSDALEGMIDNDVAASGWTAETGSRPETKSPQVGKYRIEVWEQYAQPMATQQLLDDASIDVVAWLLGKIADILGRTENTAFVRGDGSGKPTGFMNYPIVATADATRKWGQLQYVPSGSGTGFIDPTASDSPADCLIDLIYSMRSTYRAGAAFAMNSKTAGEVRKFKDAQGRFIWQDSLQAGQPSLLLGYPVAMFEDMDDIGANKYPVAFANWKRAYTIVDHATGMRLLRDPYTQKGFVKFYTTKRTGGSVTGFDALKLLKIAAT